jgi:hypothetical protein
MKLMKLSAERVRQWQSAKADLLLPIVYLRGFALASGEIDETTADPFNGFNVGSVLLRTGWTGDATRHVFESPVLRLTQPPYNYRLAFSDGIRGLGIEAREELKDWKQFLEGQQEALGSPPQAVIAIYRYYDVDSHLLGEGKRAGMETYGWGLGRLIVDLLQATQSTGVYLVAHSMGGLVARAFLQNEIPLDQKHPTLGKNCEAVEALIEAKRVEPISQEEWANARAAVRRLFTYGTPHNGITGQGGIGNNLLGALGAVSGFEIDNFNRTRIRTYLGSSAANSLDGKFPIDKVFCLIGTGSSDYPVADGFSRRLIGERSDGLVEVENAYVYGPDPNLPGQTILAARAYVRRAHSGPYGMVNSEEGFGNLSRFIFGDVRVDGKLVVRQLDLPPALQGQRAANPNLKINASYSFEVLLRVRGESWAMTERLSQNGSAAFRRYDELLGKSDPTDIELTERQRREKTWNKIVELFTAYLDTHLRADPAREEQIEGTVVRGTMGFAARLRVAVPDYEVDGRLWRINHYEGSALFDQDLLFLAFKDESGHWGLAWGPNRPDSGSEHLEIIRPSVDPMAENGAKAFYRAQNSVLQFWLPLQNQGPPIFRAWLLLTAQRVNDEVVHTPPPTPAP